MQAYFKEGEEVIFQSIDDPSISLECRILLGPIWGGKAYKCPHCGECWYHDSSVVECGYILDVIIPHADSCCAILKQKCIKKKPKPSTKSFEDIMKNPGDHLEDRSKYVTITCNPGGEDVWYTNFNR